MNDANRIYNYERTLGRELLKAKDDLSTYLEEYALPSQTINVTIARNDKTMTVAVELGARPAPSG